MIAKMKYWVGLLTMAMFMVGNSTAQACATCFGKSDSKLAAGMNWGIFTLLVIVMGVLGGISAFFIFIARRTAQVGREKAETNP